MKLHRSMTAGFVFLILISGFMAAESTVFAKNSSAPKAAGEGKAKSGEARLSLTTKGDEYVFDKTKLTAKAGQKVQVTFKNSSNPSSALEHNWVLVKPGTADKVANEGIQAGADKGWIPVGSPDILASTKLIKAGQSETVTFTAPSEPGDYPYLCTFPGHATMMKGILTVTK